MIVVDTNVIAYLFFEGVHQKFARLLFKNDPQWIAPVLWRSEFRNVLAMYLKQNLITLSSAIQIMAKAEELMKGREFSVDSNQVLRLVSNSSCSAYDCEFVALAQHFDLKLCTSDKKINKVFPELTVALQSIV